LYFFVLLVTLIVKFYYSLQLTWGGGGTEK